MHRLRGETGKRGMKYCGASKPLAKLVVSSNLTGAPNV